MAGVKVNSGAVTHNDLLSEVGEDRWYELFLARRMFVQVSIPHDCRMLLRYAEDAEQMFGPLGYESVEDFFRRGLEIDPDTVTWALKGLERLCPDEREAAPVPLTDAYEAGLRAALEAPPIEAHGTNQHDHGGGDNITSTPETRGTSLTYTIRRLKRDRPDLVERVAAGELSPNAAAIEAGFRKRTIQLTDGDESPMAAKLIEKLGSDRARAVALIILERLE